mgnify:CR=1 FL=1
MTLTNRYSKGIVYKFADGIVEITLEDYLRDNPDKTEEDFAELKAMRVSINWYNAESFSNPTPPFLVS